MLRPETDFIGQADKDTETLTKIFRRYSRCDDIFVTPLEHARRMSERISAKFQRHSGTEMGRRMARRLWPVGELVYELQNGTCQDSIDLGLKDKTAISRTFTKIRDDLISNAHANEPVLKRA